MITKQQILDEMERHMFSAYDNGNINDGGIHGGEEAADAILNLLLSDVSKQVCETFLSDSKGTSASMCRFCGKEQWQHKQAFS